MDLNIWVQRMEDGIQVVRHTFYKKEVSSPFTILKRSAVSYNTKKNTLLQEALRRLGNISNDLPWSETKSHMDIFSNMMRISGYSIKERYHIIKGSIERHKQMLAEVES